MEQWQIGVAANLVIGVVYLMIMVGIMRPVLAARRRGLDVLGASTAAIFLSCAVHHAGHAAMVITTRHMQLSGPLMAAMVVWDLTGMGVGVAYWMQRRQYGNLLRTETLFTDLQEGRRLAAEQAALLRVAHAVAEERDPDEIFHLVAQEVSTLTGAECGVVARFEGDAMIVVGTHGLGAGPLGARYPGDGRGALSMVARTGQAAMVEYAERDDPVCRLASRAGFQAGVAAPIMVSGAVWGGVMVASADAASLARPELLDRLSRLADLVALALANTQSRLQLAERAATDALTGLPNHRTFHDLLAAEADRASRHGGRYALLVLDIDHFKEVNDTHGHQAGDRVLIEIARRLEGSVRSSDVAARIGGEEFAVLMPGAREEDALRIAHRIGRVVRETPFPGVGRLTVSGGVCGSDRAPDHHHLVRYADGALYWAKAHGRDTTFVYSPDVVQALSAAERAEALLRERALAGLNALAQAVDAKDHSTREHSERVAEISMHLAMRLGWAADDVARIRQAGLLHDVGKIGVPDHILLKPGALTPEEFELVKVHAPLGAQIVSDVLDAEQVAWVRNHHERWNGAGYPDGLREEQIPAGARILALADAWDAMTAPRPYSPGMDTQRALEECRRNAGVQFAPDVVEALLKMADSRELCALSPGAKCARHRAALRGAPGGRPERTADAPTGDPRPADCACERSRRHAASSWMAPAG